MLEELSIVPLCEGVETAGELRALRDLGVSLVQGYVLAKPKLEGLAGAGAIAPLLASAA
jgi:EAL domain-containing protein (putative c-di-GMP-specific phosphodiesterase class I)